MAGSLAISYICLYGRQTLGKDKLQKGKPGNKKEAGVSTQHMKNRDKSERSSQRQNGVVKINVSKYR